MPSPFAHIAAGYALYRLVDEKSLDYFGRFHGLPLILPLIAGVSLLPDLDVIVGIFLGDMSRFHNNISHSLIAGFVAALIIASLVTWKRKGGWLPIFGVALAAYELHLFLDLFTGDRGLMLLWPITQTRFTAPIKLFYGVQWGLGLFNVHHIWTLLTEILFFLIIFAIAKLVLVIKRKLYLYFSNRSI